MSRIRLGIYVEDAGPKLGRGKILLLRAVDDLGSISAAARSMGMAYRHAWSLIDELNQCFSKPVVVTTMGGRKGGGACLTAWGRDLIERFEEMERVANRSISDQIRDLERHLARSKPAARRKSRRSRPADG